MSLESDVVVSENYEITVQEQRMRGARRIRVRLGRKKTSLYLYRNEIKKFIYI